MSFEHIFTSVPKGIKPGSRGFSSVGFTGGMPANYVQFCESISGYVHLFTPEDPNYTKNPPAFSHLLAVLGGRTFSILSRVGSCGIDYTGRTNKLAHHLMISPEERTTPGPAVLMNRGGMFMEQWSGEPCFLPPNNVKLSNQDVTSCRATTWEKILGEADGAGILAQTFLDSPNKPAFILFEPGMDLLPLLAEAQALLPVSRRWDVTFNTYFTTLPVGMECAWRCCLPDSDALKVARRTPGVLIIDLPNRRIDGPRPTNIRLVEAARTGQQLEPERQVKSIPPPLKTTPKPGLGQRGPATRQPQPLQRAAIRMNYDDALRPRPPKLAASPKISLWLTVAAALVMTIGSVFYYRQFHGTLAGREEANTSITNSDIHDSNVPLLKPLADDTPPTVEKAYTNNVVQVVILEKKPELQIPEPTQNSLSKPKQLNVLQNEQRMMLLDGIGHDNPQLPQSTNVVLRFWDTNGVEIAYKYKTSLMGDDPSYVAISGGCILARLRKDNQLTQINSTVQLVELEYFNTNHLYVIRPLRVAAPVSESSGEFRVVLPQTPSSKKVFEYLNAQNISEKLIVHGQRAHPSDEVKLTTDTSSLKNESIIVVKYKPWLDHEQELIKESSDISKEIAANTEYAKELTACADTINKAIEKFNKAKKIDPTKDKKPQEKERKESESALKKCITDALESYFSKTNLASKSSSPISLLNSFKMSLFDEAKRKAESEDKKDLIKGYDQNDCKSLCALVMYFEGSKLRDLGFELCADYKLLKPRIKALQDAEQPLANKKGEIDKTLSAWQKEPIKITAEIETTHIFEGNPSLK